MADTLEIECFEYKDIQNSYPHFNMKFEEVDYLYKKGKEPIVLHADFVFDTLAAALGEISDPTNDVLNFAAPQQVYFRSSAAADQSLTVKVIGQIATVGAGVTNSVGGTPVAGDFGVFILTTDDTDGTTPVDCGTWNVIFATIPVDTFAGNAIIDDDGASTTVFFTMALGADDYTGIIHVPNGYYASILEASIDALDTPGFTPTDTADTVPDAVYMRIADVLNGAIDFNNLSIKKTCPNVFEEQEQIKLEYRYETAVVSSFADVWIALWKA